ncbi:MULTISPECIES: GNAT family N-acetyltransferase [Bacillus]|jgi:ribosomal-protein-serine acetyltransferase|uniref:GNAT family N-acetyltransferase n=1 Tax=Bacillus TaxID=1386 RepID=UPI00049FA39C|nr:MULTISPECIES: GNAT family protein [Bacillus]AOC57738.1 GNAT family N-acetyltransferase [Bacillus pumilus]AZV54726.1 N-acetyltransferase [Bacillus pumilus]MBR0587913.1 GNAT family N-acetyltransferase [Bacillus pumilus DW2J2]MBR0617311.1 GNAT family N-acetyltransferase [Bacillus pumilus]MBR0626245.1 GNAT family N-acetyltransferase [Bacillus pumilus]
MFVYQDQEISMRLLEPRDARSLYLLIQRSREHLREWMLWVDSTQTEEDSMAFIQGAMQQAMQNNGFQAGIWSHGELVGIIGTHQIHWINRTVSIGYWLGEGYQGKGIMTKACQAVIRYLFEECGLHRIEIRAAVDNQKSRRIAERLSFSLEGILRQCEWLGNRFTDHCVYALLQPEYMKQKTYSMNQPT